MKRTFVAILAALAAAPSPTPASAQLPPTAGEIASYCGLFAVVDLYCYAVQLPEECR